MRDEPQGSVDQREPMMEPVPAQRSHADAVGADATDRAVGVAPVPDSEVPDGEEAHDARVRDDEFRPADAEADAEPPDAESSDAERVHAEPVDAEGTDAERANGEPADGAWTDERMGRPAVDVELPEDAVAREHGEDVAASEDGGDWAAREEPASDSSPAGGVPDDAVSSADAPVPAAAYEGDDRTDRASEETRGEETHGELMPGDVPEQPVSALFDQSTADDFRDRWQRVQMQFVDDPRAAADQARALVDDALNALHEGLNNQRGALDGWQSDQPDDTEQLRVAIRRYRDFLDRMLGI